MSKSIEKTFYRVQVVKVTNRRPSCCAISFIYVASLLFTASANDPKDYLFSIYILGIFNIIIKGFDF